MDITINSSYTDEQVFLHGIIISNEHVIDPTSTYHDDSDFQLERINVYCYGATDDYYVPYAILMDLEPRIMDSVRAGPFGQPFKSYILCPSRLARTTVGRSDTTPWMQSLSTLCWMWQRRRRRGCDCLQGFQLCHSLGDEVGEPRSQLHCLFCEAGCHCQAWALLVPRG